eukprot:scaffold3134_cov414-Prasinococcus_capsulatus_cf.AAC.14
MGLWRVQEELGDWLEDQYVTTRQTNAMRLAIKTLLQEVREEAVNLCDAWGFTDFELNSVLGRADGNVYPHLLRWAEASSMNSPTTEACARVESLVPAQRSHSKM